ncbi:MAG: MBL fold metallo-hydrolase [Hyphomicrobiales bacterium]|nr:MBL fold metallo-hydrolase [Hyphomicrobiales bacterium]
MRALFAFVLLCAGLARAGAAEVEKCPDMVASRPPFLKAALAPDHVRLTFVGHASFLIESPGGVTAVTDYNDYVRSPVVPVIATMNHAHSTHYSLHPDPGIKHLLRGWGEDGHAPRWNVTEGDMRVRNVPTNIRDWAGGTEYEGNSIFIFETAGLCIAHLGHLHHRLTADDLGDIGHVDVLLAPVDGTWTMGAPQMLETIVALHAPLTIPMHMFGPTTLARFLDLARPGFEIRRQGASSVELSREALPARPTVLVLDGH